MKYLLFVFLFLLSVSIYAQNNYAYEPTEITLEGVIQKKTAYGPPNFGENPKTRAKERTNYYAIKINNKIDFTINTDDSNEEERNIDIIQIYGNDKITKLIKNFLNKKVKVKGKAFHANTAYHFEKVLMEITSIEKGK